MNRSNVPYVIAAALLVLALGGWGIFLTNDHGPAATPGGKTGADAGDAGRANPDVADADVADSGLAIADLADAGAPGAESDAGTLLLTNRDLEVVPVPSMMPDTGYPLTAPPEAPSAALPAKPARPDGSEPPAGRAAISPAAVRTVIASMKPTLKVCYETLLSEFPEASGKVLVTFRVESQAGAGRVTVVEVDEETSLMDEKLLDCLTDAFADAEFPLPEDGDTIQVTYPFTFATK